MQIAINAGDEEEDEISAPGGEPVTDPVHRHCQNELNSRSYFSLHTVMCRVHLEPRDALARVQCC